MPRLLIFAPCHRVLIDQDNNLSLISVFQELVILASESIPDDAKAVIQWDAVAVWGQTPEDDGRTYEQDVLLLAPDGTLVGHTKNQFSVSVRQQRIVSRMYGFPVKQPGEYRLLLKLKDMADESTFILESSFPMFVIHEGKISTV